MGRIDKIKREMIMEANKRLLNEMSDIKVIEPEMTDTTKSSDRGLKLECIKLTLRDDREQQVEVGYAGPYPWDLVDYDKNIRPVKLYVYREGKPRDVVWGGSNDYEMVIGFEEIFDTNLREDLGLNKKYIMTTTQSPGLTGKQYCRVDGSMDKDWNDNFFNLNQSTIQSDPDFSKFID